MKLSGTLVPVRNKKFQLHSALAGLIGAVTTGTIHAMRSSLCEEELADECLVEGDLSLAETPSELMQLLTQLELKPSR